MELNRKALQDASAAGVLSESQAEALWRFLETRNQDVPRFKAAHILYYLGGMLAIGAMSLFMNLGWERFGGWGLMAIALGYGAAGLAFVEFLLHRRLAIPAGIAGAFVVVLVPLAVYGLQVGLGWWADGRPFRAYHTHIDWRWLMMELATLAAAAILLWRYRLPFMVMPVAVTLWYISMDLVPYLSLDGDYDWQLRKLVSLWFGLAMALFAFWVDVRTRQQRDFAFWLYLFGVVAFWGGLSTMDSHDELGKFLYFCINLAMIGIGAALARRVFVVFGGLGASFYLGHLAYDVFKDSVLFPFMLTALGLLVIWLGILWTRNEEAIVARLRARLPVPLREMLDARH